jgi:hypothetical protein
VPSILYDVEHWRECADKARSLANKAANPETKQKLLDVAKGYDRIAQLSEEQARLIAEYKLSD